MQEITHTLDTRNYSYGDYFGTPARVYPTLPGDMHRGVVLPFPGAFVTFPANADLSPIAIDAHHARHIVTTLTTPPDRREGDVISFMPTKGPRHHSRSITGTIVTTIPAYATAPAFTNGEMRYIPDVQHKHATAIVIVRPKGRPPIYYRVPLIHTTLRFRQSSHI